MPSGAQRNVEVGLVWVEKLTNATGTIVVPMQSAIRVRATGATTVTIGGVLSMTMSAGEIERFNAGTGPIDGKSEVTIVIAGAPAFVQVGKEIERSRHER